MQGGIADHTACLAERLAPLDVAASILIHRRWQDVAGPALTGDPAVHALIPAWNWRAWPAIARFIRTYRPDVLHIQYQAAAFDLAGWVNWLPWYLRRRGGAPRLVTTFHDLRIPYLFPRAGPLRWRAILALARHSDAVICTNRADLEALRQALRLPENGAASRPRLALIPLGSNVEPQPPAGLDRAAWRQRYGAGEQTLLLAYFGFLNESKGGEELIEALAILRRQGLDARLLFIGGDVGHADPTNAAYAQRVRALVEQYGLSGEVYTTGYTDLASVSANLMAADAVVMPYRDGVSFRRTTLIAALRHGCPVVSTTPADPAAVTEIRPGENMLLAPPCDAAGLAGTIAQLAGDPALRRRLACGAQTLGAQFDWPPIAAATAELYRTITER